MKRTTPTLIANANTNELASVTAGGVAILILKWVGGLIAAYLGFCALDYLKRKYWDEDEEPITDAYAFSNQGLYDEYGQMTREAADTSAYLPINVVGRRYKPEGDTNPKQKPDMIDLRRTASGVVMSNEANLIYDVLFNNISACNTVPIPTAILTAISEQNGVQSDSQAADRLAELSRATAREDRNFSALCGDLSALFRTEGSQAFITACMTADVTAAYPNISYAVVQRSVADAVRQYTDGQLRALCVAEALTHSKY